MKNKHRIISLILVLLTLSAMLVSCSSGENDNALSKPENDWSLSGDVSQALDYALTIISKGESDYQIVRADKLANDHEVVKSVQELRDTVEKRSGVKLELSTDWLKPGDRAPEKEILVGDTNREESLEVKKTLREKDYAIEVVGSKLVIIGGNDEATAKAVEKFITLYFAKEQKSLVLNGGYRYQKRYDYPAVGMEINGTPVLDFKIVYAQNYEGSAKSLASYILEKSGFAIEALPESSEKSEHEIYVGNAVRQESADLSGNEYRVYFKDGRLFFAGSDPFYCSYAVRAFAEDVFAKSGEKLVIDTKYDKNGKVGELQSINVLSLNLTLSGYAENSVPNRYPRVLELVNQKSPDVICFQELSCTTWYECITKGNGESLALTDKYSFVGIGRNGEKGSYDVHVEGAYNAILFDKEKFELVDSGTFWLSDTPTTPSVGWDGRTRAICTWAQLKDKTSGRSFALLNTQLDPYGKESGVNAVEQIKEFTKAFSVPVVLCGDFGSTAKDKPYKSAVQSFTNVLESSEATVNNYGALVSGGASDFVMVSTGSALPGKCELVKDLYDGKYASSHWAIMAEIKLA